MDLDVKGALGKTSGLGGDSGGDAQIGQSASDNTTRKPQEGLSPSGSISTTQARGGTGEPSEGIILEDIDTSMISTEVIDLTTEDGNPKVFTDELDDIKILGHIRPSLGIPFS